MPANQKYSSNEIRLDKALIVFVRYPEPGKVKTRLAKETNENFACDVYKIWAENIFREVKPLKYFNNYVFYSEEKDEAKIIKWTNNEFVYFPQQGNDLGERMLNAFRIVLNQQNQKAIIIGTDIPDLSKEIILEAAGALDENDIVIGPSYDGGYYLLGMKKVIPHLFQNVEWSSNSVFSSTISKARSTNLKLKELQPLHDIDTKEGLNNWLLETNNAELKREILSLLEKNNISNL